MIASVLDIVKEYVQKTTTTEIDLPIKNIFKYVAPKIGFIPQSKNTAKLAIMCNYKFDMEHGIAIVSKMACLRKLALRTSFFKTLDTTVALY